MRISDWSSDVCSSDLHGHHVLSVRQRLLNVETASIRHVQVEDDAAGHCLVHHFEEVGSRCVALHCKARHTEHETGPFANSLLIIDEVRSEEHTSELQSLMRISYAVFGLKKTH